MSAALSPLEQLEQQSAKAQPSQQAAPASNLSPLEQLEQSAPKTPPTQTTSIDPAQEASNTRQMLVSGLTGMPTPNMTAADKASFERGKAAGAVSVPIVAAGTAGATAAPEIIPQVVQKAKAVAEWAKANPIKSVAIAKIADELGIHPFDFMHSVVKYGKNLFGVSEPNSQ